jgi:hypothetical protein
METDPAALRDFAAHYTAAWCSKDPERVVAFFSPAASLTANGDIRHGFYGAGFITCS